MSVFVCVCVCVVKNRGKAFKNRFCLFLSFLHHLKKFKQKRASLNSCAYVLVIKKETFRVFVLVFVYSIKPVMVCQIFYASVCELVRV
jgi:hypothetical protein